MTSLIPKVSSPLSKAIRTAEGIFISVLGTLTAVTSLVDPKTLSHKEAAILMTIQGGALMAQRGLLKAVALQKGIGIGAPIDNSKLDETSSKVVQAAEEVKTLVGQHQQTVDSLLSTVEHLPDKSTIDKLMQQLESYANGAPAPSPAAETLPVPTAQEEAAVQPPAPVPASATPADGPTPTPPPAPLQTS